MKNVYSWLSHVVLWTVFFSFITLQGVQAQNLNDLSHVQVEQLSDAQVKDFVEQIQATGMSVAQLEQIATARGMQPGEIQKLKERVAGLYPQAGSQPTETGNNPRLSKNEQPTTSQRHIKSEKTHSGPRIFGHELFYNARPQFTPDLSMATPMTYVVGPGDELMLSLYGNSVASYQLTVSPEGKINIPYAGMVSVSGQTIEEVTAQIRHKLSSIYPGISSGATKVNISLGQVRSIHVILAGEVTQPGTYTLPSVATVFNALYAAGGPTQKGSLRTIKVFRSGKLVSQMDVYQFLTTGKLSGNIMLQDQDVILVSPAHYRVSVKGEVMRPMLFDAKQGETFKDILRYAGGFTDKAYTARVTVSRLTDRSHAVQDLKKENYAHFVIHKGDEFTVGKILDRYKNRVQITGAVFNPGTYELTKGLTLSQLIKEANGIKEDAFMNLGYIDRENDKLEPTRIKFSLKKILDGTQRDILLHKEDIVHISSIFDLRDHYTLRIEGEVRKPGKYVFRKGSTVKDLILQAGGFTESATAKRIEISRRVRINDSSQNDAQIADIFYVDLKRDLSGTQALTPLQPYDIITVRSAPGYESQQIVRVVGEVKFPGLYTLKSKDARISDVIKRAGGLTAFAYAKGGSLKREGAQAKGTVKSKAVTSQSEVFATQQEQQMARERQQEYQRLLSTTQDTNAADAALVKNTGSNYVGIYLDDIIEDVHSKYNILLQDGDVIYVPRKLQTVKVSGEVLSPINIVYRKGMSFRDYVAQAGGFTSKALERKSYVIYANGSVASTKKVLGLFNNYPKIKPGAEIFVPSVPERQKLSPQAWIGLSTGFASLAAIIITIFK